MDKLDRLIIKLENEIEAYRVVCKSLGHPMEDIHLYQDAADYLKMLKQIYEIVDKDNGKSATKSFEYMDQIKEVLKQKINKTGFNTEKQYMDIIESVKKKGYWDK